MLSSVQSRERRFLAGMLKPQLIILEMVSVMYACQHSPLALETVSLVVRGGGGAFGGGGNGADLGSRGGGGGGGGGVDLTARGVWGAIPYVAGSGL